MDSRRQKGNDDEYLFFNDGVEVLLSLLQTYRLILSMSNARSYKVDVAGSDSIVSGYLSSM